MIRLGQRAVHLLAPVELVEEDELYDDQRIMVYLLLVYDSLKERKFLVKSLSAGGQPFSSVLKDRPTDISTVTQSFSRIA
ncbi:hypothetical protein ACFL2Q_13620 [Thermodesulfobacteriota bacterium]